ncbi:MAG TPA: 4-hydroxy-tetrahydrodipicolinate reductase [Phycisphaerales bacterium]|nr:4-hydroxy-tetrahydrodipicolinate reductase [Phycisphaerales bacterium]
MSKRQVQVMVHGRDGRMGSRVVDLLRNDARFKVVETLATDTRKGARSKSEQRVIIDFTSDAGAREIVGVAINCRAAVLVCSTGLSDKTLRAIRNAEKSVPVMAAPNTSRGVAVLAFLVRKAVELLGPGVDADLIEYHHTMKKDSPSGTALRLAAAANKAVKGALPAAKIHAVRAGDIVGEHHVHLAIPGERIFLSHAATSRDVFARGAIEAAHWLAHQSAGAYQIEDSLGLART